MALLFMLSAGFVLRGALAQGEEACDAAAQGMVQSHALLQHQTSSKAVSADTRVIEETHQGHRLLLLAKQQEDGSYTLPEKLRRISQTQLASSGLAGEMQAVLDLHNLYRCMHDVPAMVWDEGIAEKAQEWASDGGYTHSSNSFRNFNGVQHGENIAWGYPSRSAEDAATAWYDEVLFTDGTPTSCSDTVDGSSEAICHFTQVVWASSVKLGCGKGKAEVTIAGEAYNGDFVVCMYADGGNMAGQFGANVLGPTKTAEECPTAPTPAPAPGPPIEEETHDPDCQDGAPIDNPVIRWSSGDVADCATMAHYGLCTAYTFVAAKCKESCNAC